MSLAENVEYLRRLGELNGITGFGNYPRNLRPGPHSPLSEVDRFGSNPGELKMFAYVPAQRLPSPPLVVVRTTPVAVCVALIAAPGMARPLESFTTPLI